MTTFAVAHDHRHGTDIFSVDVTVPAETRDVVAALYLSDPNQYELEREGEELRIDTAGKATDVTLEVELLFWLRTLKIGDRVRIIRDGKALDGTLVWTTEDPEPIESMSGSMDFGLLFTSPEQVLRVRLDSGEEIDGVVSALLAPVAAPQPGKRRVTVTRTETRTVLIEVADCETDDQARDRALDEAGNYDFREANCGDPVYDVESVERL